MEDPDELLKFKILPGLSYQMGIDGELTPLDGIKRIANESFREKFKRILILKERDIFEKEKYPKLIERLRNKSRS